MAAKVTWKGGMDFKGESTAGFVLDITGSAALGGSEEGFRPMELMALGLAGCTAIDVISILHKKRQEISDFQVQVHADRSDQHPTVWTKVQIKYLITGKQVDSKAVEKAIELSATKYCPAQNIIDDSIEIVSTYEITETNSGQP